MRWDDAAGGLRAGLLLLVVLGVAGTALALAYERHWLSAWQFPPWITLGIISVAVVALVVRQTTATVVLARAVAVLAVVSAALGVWQHIDVNLDPHAAADHHAGGQTSMAAGTADPDSPGATVSDDHHADDEDQEATARDDHHADDEEAPELEDHQANDEGAEETSAGPSLGDVMAGSAGQAPVPAALAIAPVGLALGLATIGLGGGRRRS